MVPLSSLGLVSTPKDSDCYPTQHGRPGMNQVPVQEGGFARRAEVLCFLSPRAGPEKPMFHALISGPLDKESTEHVHYENHVPWLGFNDDLPKTVSQGS